MGSVYSGMCRLCGGATFDDVCIMCKHLGTGDFTNSKYITLSLLEATVDCVGCNETTCEFCEIRTKSNGGV